MKRRFSQIALLIIPVLLISCATAFSQKDTEKKTPVPVIPFIAEYEYHPYFFAQWIADHSQYSRIEATLDDLQKTSFVQIVLIEKESGKRVYYSTSEAQAKALRAEGREVYAAKIDFKQAQTQVDEPPAYGFGFRDKNGQAILWRVLSATRPSERGGGLIPLSAVPGLRLEYRKLGTAVGEGTTIQIGDKTIEAEPWKEISNPPYFVAYRGTVALGRHYGGLVAGAKKWQVQSSPAELKEGAEWIMKDESGRRRVFKITARSGDELTIEEAEAAETSLTQMSLGVRLTDAGFALRSVRFVNRSQKMRIGFSPELPLDARTSGKFETAFVIDEGEADKIVNGTVSGEWTENKLSLRWQPKSPDWTKSRFLETTVKMETDGYSVESLQPAK